ncbi:MAG TPA: hydantoinase B/oxoprolinase family protein [Candidatus Dormibacteraeota bacterium]|nr:hydantoinase B/oxoprolinase family protein [Candidatus Dormibacteraeota bacterium]
MATTTTKIGPVELEVILGTIRSAEIEIEAATERTARSPMIRDQHDYRVALFDGRCRKLTGRSYSALVEPVFEHFGREEINPGDVFFWNDPYNSAGSIGHVPDLCTTIPIFSGKHLIGFSQVFGHHDDVGGMVPGSLPVHATDQFQEGLVIPPIKLYDRGRLNSAVFKILTRNSRLPEYLEGDIDAEIGAARLGSRRIEALAEHYGVETLEAAYDAIVENCTRTIREELLPRIKDGVYQWEDYVECDGVDAPRLHALRLTMTKTPERIVLDFNGTDPQAKGPINWAINYCDGRFVRKWMGPILRNLAATPERAAEIDMNEGVCDVLEVVLPPPGTLVSPVFPAPTGLRFFLLLRALGVFAGCLAKATAGRMPADQESIRIWGIHGQDRSGKFFLFREVLGGGSGGRYYGDGSDVVHIVPNSRNLPAEFSEQRYPILIEHLGLTPDSGGAGQFRGGLGYDKRVRALDTVGLLSNGDRSLVNTYGLNGGQPGATYGISILRGDGEVVEVPGLADAVPVGEGDLIRIRTTGGGGWGDPLDRDPEAVLYDVGCGLVSVQAALQQYGVVVSGQPPVLDFTATERRRQEMRSSASVTMFARGAFVAEERAQGRVSWPPGWDEDMVDGVE